MYLENEEEYQKALRLLEEMYRLKVPEQQVHVLKAAIIDYEDKHLENQD